MRKIFLTATVSLSFLALFLIHSCAKSINDGFTEPITVISPDSLTMSNVPAGTVESFNIQFTTDRPILWAKGVYQIDTPGAAVSTLYPDTLFYLVLDSTPSKWTNKYNYKGTYAIPDSARSQTAIRFDIQFKAALNPSSNPPNTDTVFYDKQFQFTVL